MRESAPNQPTEVVGPSAKSDGNDSASRSAIHRRHDVNRADFLIALSFLGDTVVILLGLCLGFWIKFRSGLLSSIPYMVDTPDMPFSDYFELILIGTGFLLTTFAFLKLYDSRKLLRYRQNALVILKGSTLWLFAYLSLSLALKFDPPISRAYVVCSFLTTLSLLLLWRFLFHQFLSLDFIARKLRQTVLFVSWNNEAEKVADQISKDPTRPYEILGCVTAPDGSFAKQPPRDIQRFGHYRDLAAVLDEGSTDMVILSDLDSGKDEVLALATLCDKAMVQFKIMPSYFQILVSGLRLETISGIPIMGVSELPLDRFINRAIKRWVDIVGALVGLILSAPIIMLSGFLVYMESPGPIFYRQVRTGRKGKTFKIIKLRSMRLDAELEGAQWAKKDDPRRLKIGAFMREWNIDELPQFWNVLTGEMSLVGPRPERPELIEQFKEDIPHYNARHSAKPGITGWAQINGFRGDTNLVERVRYDLFYLENWNLFLDFQIMIQTFFKRDNAY
jgi:exopolysaccharide biosynthesis polyprenyl glycosylphosphotransferase